MSTSKKFDDLVDDVEETWNNKYCRQVILGATAGSLSGAVSVKAGIMPAGVLGGLSFLAHYAYTRGEFGSGSKMKRDMKKLGQDILDEANKYGRKYERETGNKIYDNSWDRLPYSVRNNILFAASFAGAYFITSIAVASLQSK